MAPKIRLHSWLHTIAPLFSILCLTHSYVSALKCEPSSDPKCREQDQIYGSKTMDPSLGPQPNKETNVGNQKCVHRCDSEDKCVSSDQICDLHPDCAKGDDEQQSCELLTNGSYCSFGENDYCFWQNLSSPSPADDGYWVTEVNDKDWYLSAKFPPSKHIFGRRASIKSNIFEPIPFYNQMESSKYFNSCHVRFLYLLSAPSSEILLEVVEKNPNYRRSGKRTELWRDFRTASGQKMDVIPWTRVSLAMPHMTHQYELQFTFSPTFRPPDPNTRNRHIIGLDNISLSKECFGIDVPESEPRATPRSPPQTNIEFTIPKNASLKSFRLSSCGAKGRVGPDFEQCEKFYSNSPTRASVVDSSQKNVINGTQMWTVSQTGYYTIFARGANGGHGLHTINRGGSGALVRAVFKFQEGDTIFTLIGQTGTDACNEDLIKIELKNKCQTKRNRRKRRDTYELKKALMEDTTVGGAGGGGGATYVFKMVGQNMIPLIIAGGGGGGGSDDGSPVDLKLAQGQNGRGFDPSSRGSIGSGNESGGGWFADPLVKRTTSGSALLDGAQGGYVCELTNHWTTNGGFGGGGGGCISGGGGGGYQGGDSYQGGKGGQGGSSYVNKDFGHLAAYTVEETPFLNNNETVAEVVIFPQIPKCCNNELFGCVVTGQTSEGELKVHCICNRDQFEADECLSDRSFTILIVLSITFLSIILIVIFVIIGVIKYKKSCNVNNRTVYGNGRDASASQLLSNSSTDVQLSRLRSGHNIITEYNPNYEFGGSTCTLQDLREVPREKLTLIKALGQGAFGEVYQGFLHNMPGEITDELPVAVKTLPEYSANNQAEMDFLMEALIMSKFKHRNIVRFIGVCFEKMPRFIVLELLPGGDLKTFLRESRGTSLKPSLLNMGDLLVMALDVALGCQYLEENHFIHRDIAARNCLLSSKIKSQSANVNNINTLFNIINYNNGFNNSGVVVKIADFGMARDIYRADYYRKGGKAMLPVKWMPPEAFLDGIFTSKTDVWSFGVLLWEVMSMGYMPYPGRGNQEVMQLVTAGGRLESPNASTPPQVYAIMTQCWNPGPENRPTFATIIERLGYCLQDPDVLNVKLPIFQRAPSMEKDMTLMRPPPDATDYLVPNNPCSNSNSNYSMSTEKTELLSPDTCSTFSCSNEDNKLLELLDDINPPVIPPRAGNWKETSFSDKNSIPKNQMVSKANGIKSEVMANKSSGQPLVLDASALLQNPSRYMNVNVKDGSETTVGANNVRSNAQQINC